MPLFRAASKIVLSFILVIALLPSYSLAQKSKLGRVDFPTSGSGKAAPHFLRGLAALHSFWYEEALDAFREATKVDPDFMMGYWGEAMAHNHPLWDQQDTEAARKALARIKGTEKLTPRERAYIEAARALYGEGDKLARDRAYMAAMEKLYRDYPNDLEAASFYSLSLLGTVRPGDKGFSRQMKAAAIALDVYSKNPDHPGAAHYIIHSLDEPEHAILALPAARRYAEIAPDAHHARHMPSHIFLQLGMWPEAASSNETAWAVSDAWVKRKNLPIVQRDYHSLSWLQYIYLQQGRYAKAEELLKVMERAMAESDAPRLQRTYADMAATYAVETGKYDSLPALLSVMKGGGPKEDSGAVKGHHCKPSDASADKKAAEKSSEKPGDKSGKAVAQTMSYNTSGENVRVPFVRGLAAASSGSVEDAEKYAAAIASIRKKRLDRGEAYEAKRIEIMELEVLALAKSAKGNHDEAIEIMKKATRLESEMDPPSGPPDLLKPSHEMFGEILLKAGRPKEAAEQFAISLHRQPNRARSLLGAARAATQSGDKEAAVSAYSAFKSIWVQADSQLPEMREIVR
ncbi:MAG TPA: tetratricopeptide repeat protein [Blastocatellia bacterium]|nr:tetratricopeptide repeat protein [Blastocatellia bacterium]